MNVERLKAYKARLIVFPRNAKKPKKGDSTVRISASMDLDRVMNRNPSTGRRPYRRYHPCAHRSPCLVCPRGSPSNHRRGARVPGLPHPSQRACSRPQRGQAQDPGSEGSCTHILHCKVRLFTIHRICRRPRRRPTRRSKCLYLPSSLPVRHLHYAPTRTSHVLKNWHARGHIASYATCMNMMITYLVGRPIRTLVCESNVWKVAPWVRITMQSNSIESRQRYTQEDC